MQFRRNNFLFVHWAGEKCPHVQRGKANAEKPTVQSALKCASTALSLFHSCPFHSRPFHSRPFHSRPFHSRLFHSCPFQSCPFHNPIAAERAPCRASLPVRRCDRLLEMFAQDLDDLTLEDCIEKMKK